MPLRLAFYATAILAIVQPAKSWSCDAVTPERVADLVRTIAAEEKLDIQLALAVAETESGMGRHSVSEAGAVGIMQLMPTTAADYGVKDRCDPAANIRGGVRYLKSLYERYDDPLLMLAAYNAGPGNVDAKGGIPEFAETTKYIVRVMNRWKLTEKVSNARLVAQPTTAFAKPVSTQTSPWREKHVWNLD